MGVLNFFKKGSSQEDAKPNAEESPLFTDSSPVQNPTQAPADAASSPFDQAPVQDNSFSNQPPTESFQAENDVLPSQAPPDENPFPPQQESPQPFAAAPEQTASINPVQEQEFQQQAFDQASSQAPEPNLSDLPTSPDFTNPPTDPSLTSADAASSVPDMINHQEDLSATPSDAFAQNPSSEHRTSFAQDPEEFAASEISPQPQTVENAPEQIMEESAQQNVVHSPSPPPTMPAQDTSSEVSSPSAFVRDAAPGNAVLSSSSTKVNQDIFVEKEAFRKVLFDITDCSAGVEKSNEFLVKVLDDESGTSAKLEEFKNILDNVQNQLVDIDNRFFGGGDT